MDKPVFVWKYFIFALQNMGLKSKSDILSSVGSQYDDLKNLRQVEISVRKS